MVTRGACVVASHEWLLGGHAWLCEGMCGCWGGMCGCGVHAWLLEVACVGYDEIRSMRGAVHILLECILVLSYHLLTVL